MKKYAIIDQIKDGDMFDTYFDNEKEAIDKAEYEWGQMTEHDRNRREWFAVLFGEYDEDEGFDFNASKEIKRFK